MHLFGENWLVMSGRYAAIGDYLRRPIPIFALGVQESLGVTPKIDRSLEYIIIDERLLG
jgi:hypothetical protein